MSPAAKPEVVTPSPIPAAEATTNQITAVAVEGATKLSKDTIAAATANLVGPATPTAAIEAARVALLQKYRDDSYPLVTVSASLSGGQLRFIVTEGRIAEVRLDGDIGPAGNKILGLLQNLVQSGPVRSDELERWLLLAQDLPGVTMQAVLRPSETEPGALTLVAHVTRKLISGYVAADNRAYNQSGPGEVLAVVGANSETSLGERTEVSLYKSIWQHGQIFGQASFEAYVGDSGLKIRLYGGAGDTQPNGELRTIGYDAQTQVGGLQLSYPIIYTRQQKLVALGMLDLLESSIFLGSTGGGPSTHDSLRIARLGADYALQDSVFGADHPAVNQITARLSHGLDDFGSSHTDSTTVNRIGSQFNFTKISAQISRNQVLFSPWTDATVNLLGLIAGQYTNNVVPAEEGFYLGGLQYTRGFYSGQVTGDKALAATVELQLNTNIHVDALGWTHDVGTQFYGFYDWGETWQNQTTDYNSRLRSVGLGVRSAVTDNLELDLEGVDRLTLRLSSSTAVKPLGAQALYGRAVIRY